MSRSLSALLGSAIIASMLVAPAGVSAADHKTDFGPQCVKFEKFGASPMVGTSSTGLTVTIADIQYDSSKEPTSFQWFSSAPATLDVKASGYITSHSAETSGTYVQGATADGKTHAISHVVFCSSSGDGGDGGDGGDLPAPPPCTTGDNC